MDRLYALGVSCIEFIQYWFEDSEGFFELVNDLSNPHHVLEILFPVVSVVDSVFGAQLLLCMAFGSWLNSVMKWWLLEDRPYWWVRETSFYTGPRPQLRQSRHTCETGPGCPSGHTATTATILILLIMWISHIMNDRKCYVWWWKYVVYPVFACALGSVMLARMFVATHFPHQCLLGALVGSFLAPALCIYVSDPFIWRYGLHARLPAARAVAWHIFSAAVTVAIAAVTYLSLTLCGWDPHWTVKLAFRWCESPDDIHVSTTPMYSLVQSTSALLGWALCVTPAVAQYRHDTKNRSLTISAFTTGLIVYAIRHFQDNICKSDALWFYAMHFLVGALKPALLLRLVPAVSMWPFSKPIKQKVA
ncbi:glucose-6-phosphatase catalytic subunit 1 [Galleria mellonella]|uniref:glucose-6-phosphatase n=1 Tax=Galleria mellonella TaxID=7137 RepID=A0A6J1WMW1_GALME|nr:glucose-6-phosphatase catalytic subunit 1 [Galleria mellonella]